MTIRTAAAATRSSRSTDPWNRTSPVGCQIMRITFDDAGNATGQEVLPPAGCRRSRRVSDVFAGVI